MPGREPYVDFDNLFGADYEYFDFPVLTPELNAVEVSTMVALGGMTPGMRILDAPCGHGRPANELAARGFDVVGVRTDVMNERGGEFTVESRRLTVLGPV